MKRRIAAKLAIKYGNAYRSGQEIVKRNLWRKALSKFSNEEIGRILRIGYNKSKKQSNVSLYYTTYPEPPETA